VALEKPRGSRIDEDFVRPGPLQEIAHGIRRLAVSMRIEARDDAGARDQVRADVDGEASVPLVVGSQ